MKVLFHLGWGLTPDFVGGTERFVLNLAKGIRARGADTFIVCSNLEEEQLVEGITVYGRVPPPYHSRVEQYGYANENFFRQEIIGDEFTEGSMRRFSDYVSKQLDPFETDIFHLNGFVYSTFLPDRLPLDRTVVTNHENPEELANYWGENAFPVFCQAVTEQTSSLPRVRKRVVPSRFYATFFSERLGIDVSPIPLGIDIDTFQVYRRNEALRSEYGISDEIVFLLPSRFDIRQKGHDIAVKASSILKRKGLKIKCIFSGYDKDTYEGNRADFDALVDTENLRDDVILTRFDDIRDAYSICDIVISPERFCSYGLSISESLALGLPTVMTPIPTYREIAASYGHAHFTRDLSPEELASTLLEVIASGLEPSIPEAERFRSENSFERCVDAYYGLYKGILHQN